MRRAAADRLRALALVLPLLLLLLRPPLDLTNQPTTANLPARPVHPPRPGPTVPPVLRPRHCSCGPVAVAGNTYAAMAGQGKGCRTTGSAQGWCEKSVDDFCGGEPPDGTASGEQGDTCGGQTAPVPLRAVSIGGQCNASEPSLPPECSDELPGATACARTPGVGGVCYNATAHRCVRATEFAQLVERGGAACGGFSSVCTLY